ncbi:ABC transporter substrate-binding protein [Roseomonas fluvialis]|uniref:Substrate-binding protein n=1 Tax=Roseomonas fluvialis TaxID=1750527 RepID=A0ABN6P8N4_9PROT|nr:ABC transporter substrate-binding protein [Roseomonas fluvialis]BDG74955.1 substrate-binding protein [Roseomonas fluvialis]
MRRRLAGQVLAILLLAGLVLPAAARAQTVTAVLEAEIVTLDPHFTPAYITRTFGYMVFDTLFAMNGQGQVRPQMVQDWTSSPDGLTWTFTLREGLRWHDGTPVTAADCVASLRRWGARSALGSRLLAATASIEARDARTFVLTLKEPFGLVLDTLGTTSSPVPFMMPERLARTPGTERITEIIGSGPFTYSRADHRTGDRMLLRRNAAYVPRAEPSDYLAGGKVARIDALDIRVIPDGATAVAAMRAGEIDYIQYAPFDLLGQLERDRRVRVQSFTGLDQFTGHYRTNAASGPFADPAIRRVLLHLVDQAEVMAGFGLSDRYARTCNAFFICGSPYESAVGTEPMQRPSIEAAREALRQTRYAGEPVVVLVANDLEAAKISSEILADRLRRAGFNVDMQVMDWASVLARRTRRDGWSVFGVHALGVDLHNPLTNSVIGFNCTNALTGGFHCQEGLTPLFAQFAAAPTLEARQALAAQMQQIVYGQAMAVPWGQFAQPAVHRVQLNNLIPSAIPLFWNVEKR